MKKGTTRVEILSDTGELLGRWEFPTKNYHDVEKCLSVWALSIPSLMYRWGVSIHQSLEEWNAARTLDEEKHGEMAQRRRLLVEAENATGSLHDQG